MCIRDRRGQPRGRRPPEPFFLNLGSARLSEPPNIPRAKALGSGGGRRRRHRPQHVAERNALAQVRPCGPPGQGLRRTG
eukprot:6532035-Alexandrium_andersonii.AAC.1